MLQTLMSWAWIFVSVYLVGFAVLSLLNGRKQKNDLDVIFAFGLCALTVYAQVFSLFSGVSLGASAVLALGCMIIAIVFRRKLCRVWRGYLRERRALLTMGLAAVLLSAAALVLTRGPMHYDTDLYHAQSIRWIEECGVAPGIGNLHNRLAYNSSFFCLQALYSFGFLGKGSLCSLNGFLAALLLLYGICSVKMFQQKKPFLSDFLRLGLLLYFVSLENYAVMGSPGTDLLSMGAVMYILIKWLDYWEQGERETQCYARLCLLAVYAVTLKLSTAMLVLLAFTPAAWLVRERRWKEIGKYVALGILIALPWLVRNVLISGYLIYPYPELDLFDVDWKMPEYTLLFDRNEIKAWGWGLNDVYRFDTPAGEWFPFWFGNLKASLRFLFCIDAVLLPVLFLAGIGRGLGKKDWCCLQVTGVMGACLGVWMLGAPLPRYGGAYLLLPLLYGLGETAVKLGKTDALKHAFRFTVCVLTAYGVWAWVRFGLASEEWRIHLKRSAVYGLRECTEHFLEEGVRVYTPVSGDQAGYYDFPSTPYGKRLELIEPRGDSPEDGFRMRPEYRGAYVSTYGDVAEENMFSR